MLKNQVIFVVSNEPWGDQWFCKHHYANELSKLGYNVFFINPTSSWKISNLFSFGINLIRIRENLTVVKYKNNFPLTIFPLLFQILNDFINTLKFHKLYKKKRVIWWQFDCFRFSSNFFFIRNHSRIYHVADNYMNKMLDNKLADNADLIVCTSKLFVPYYSGLFPYKKVLFIPHGISSDEFNCDERRVDEINNNYNDFVFFSGTISKNVDLSIFENIVDFKTGVLVAGKVTTEISHSQRWKSLCENDSFVYLGVLPARELKSYIKASLICISAYDFKLRKVVGKDSSLKILNYISQMKPVVTTIDSSIPELQDRIIFTANNYDEFLVYIELAKKKSIFVDSTTVQAYLNKHLYKKLINDIMINIC